MGDEGLLCSFLSANDEVENLIYNFALVDRLADDFALVDRLVDDFAIFQVRYIIIDYYYYYL